MCHQIDNLLHVTYFVLCNIREVIQFYVSFLMILPFCHSSAHQSLAEHNAILGILYVYLSVCHAHADVVLKGINCHHQTISTVLYCLGT